jgi:hypothetical protein
MLDEERSELQKLFAEELAKAVDLLKNARRQPSHTERNRITDHVDRRLKRLDERSEQLATGIGSMSDTVVAQLDEVKTAGDARSKRLNDHDERITGLEYTAPM